MDDERKDVVNGGRIIIVESEVTDRNKFIWNVKDISV